MGIRRPPAHPSLLQRSIQIGSRPPLATDSSIRNGRGSPDRVPRRCRQPPLSGPLSLPFSFPSSFPVFLSLIWSSLSPRGHPAPPTLSCMDGGRQILQPWSAAARSRPPVVAPSSPDQHHSQAPWCGLASASCSSASSDVTSSASTCSDPAPASVDRAHASPGHLAVLLPTRSGPAPAPDDCA